MICVYDETLLDYIYSLNIDMFALLTPSYFYCVDIHIENRNLNFQWKDKIIVTFCSKSWNLKKIKRCNTLWSKASKVFLAKWSRPFKRWTRKRRWMGNMIEQNSRKQNISRFPLMEAVKMWWLLTHELLWKSTVKANRRGSKHQLKHTKPGLSNNPLANQYHPRTEISIIDNCQLQQNSSIFKLITAFNTSLGGSQK